MKRRAIALTMVLTLALTLGLAACGGGSTPAPAADGGPARGESAPAAGEDAGGGTAAADGDTVQLTYTGWGSPNEKKVTQAAIDSFMQAYPHIQVEYMHIPDEQGSYDTKLTTMVAAGQTPDAALFHADLGLAWAEEGKMYNVIDLIEKDPDWSLDDILPQAVYWWDEGKAIGMNGAIEAFGLFYNRDMFEAAGLDAPPTKPEEAWTWDEFVEVCKSLTLDGQGRNAHDADFNPEDVMQYAVQIADWAYMQTVFGAGGDYISADDSSFTLTEPAALDGLQRVSDLMNVHHVMPTPVAQKNLPSMATSILSKKVAMAYEGQWILLDLAAGGANFGVGVAPRINDFMTMTLGDPLCIFADTQHPEEAYQLLKWFWNPDNTMELQTSGLWMPILKEWYTDPELVAKWVDNDAHPEGYEDAIMRAALEYGVPSQGYYVRNLPKINAIVKPAVDQIYLGEETAEEAMNRIADQVQGEVRGRYYRPDNH